MKRLLFAIWVICMSAVAAEKPNVVIILADDLGWNSVGWHNAEEARTPNLDRFCREGIELDKFYVSPMCSPTRAGLLTGRYPIRYGRARAVIPPWRTLGLPLSETTLAEALATAGYEKRGIFGKWHLGHWEKKWHPNSRGFTEFIGCYNGAIDYFSHERDGELDWHRNEDPLRQEGYATALIGQGASAFIRDAAQGEAPYFCYIPFNAPHAPYQVPEKYLAPYSQIKNKKFQTHLAMVTAMDEAIGKILATIEATGESENTLVWFLSDNGAERGVLEGNDPFHGAKLSTYEGGVRVPACVRYSKWPGGRKLDQRMLFVDVVPTLLQLAGVDTASMNKPLDGVDLAPVLSATHAALPERDLYFYHGQRGPDEEHYAIISGRWKFVVNGPDIVDGHTAGRQLELFNIENDPNESTNLASAYPEAVQGLFGKMVNFRKLQPANAIAPYMEGSEGFVAPKEWLITE